MRRCTCASDETACAASGLLPTSSATAKASLRSSTARSGSPRRNVRPAEVVEQAPDVEPVLLLLVERLRPLGVRAREHPLPLALRDDRRLEVPVRERLSVTEPFRELERRLDVGARRLPVALAPIAAGSPAEDPAPQPVVDRIGVAHQLERLGEERGRGRIDDSRYRHCPMWKRTLARSTSVKESPSTRSRAASSSGERFLDPPELGARSRLGDQRAELEIRISRTVPCLLDALERGDRLVELPCGDGRLGP